MTPKKIGAFPALEISEVAHVGSMDPDRAISCGRTSIEGFCLSVSLAPKT